MPRVLHVIDDLAPSGAATQVRLLSTAGVERGDEVAVATLRYAGARGHGLAAEGVRVAWIGRRFVFDPIAAAQLVRLVRGWRPDVVQSWDAPSARFCDAARRAARFAWLHTLRDGAPKNASERRADRWVCPTRPDTHSLAGELERVDVVPNAYAPGIRPGDADSKQAARRRLRVAGVDVRDDTPVILAATSLRDRAATNELTWIGDLVRVVRPGLRVLVAGDGPNRLACERFAAAAIEPGTVVWLGDRTDLATLYAAADLVWCGRGGGACPTPAVEAMAAGRPVLMADGPRRDALRPELGVAHETQTPLAWDDRPGWARASLRLLNDRAVAEEVGAANAARVREPHSLASVGAAHAAAVREAISTRSL